MPRGFKNGAMPSSTRKSASAAKRSDRWGSMSVRWTRAGRVSALTLARLGGASRGAWILKVFEELAVGRDEQQIPVLAERALVGLEAPVEGIELGIALVGLRIDLRRLGIGLAAHAQRIALGIGENLGALALGGRAYAHRGT